MKATRYLAQRRPFFWKRLSFFGVIAAQLVLSPLLPGQLLYQEGFNDDGEKANPQRYTTIGREAYEVARIQSELSLSDQVGPIFWGHNFEVSYVGVPAPTAGRRAMLVWDGAIPSEDVNAKTFQLLDATIKWLVNNKSGATIVFTPNMAAAQSLADHLGAVGYTVVDDVESDPDANVVADLIIKAPGNTNPSRFATAKMPVLTFSALDHDDMLTSSIGSTAAFEAGNVTVAAGNHPAATGVTGSFPLATGSHTWNLMGDNLPGGATTIANFVRRIPPSAANLAEVDAMVAGTIPTQKSTATFTELDFNDNSTGHWTVDNPFPGNATGVFGLVATGKLNVTQAGTYSFALGMDDGARLRIDVNKDGLKADDTVLTEDAGGAHRARYKDVTFPSAGAYDFEVTMFNSGGSGSLEMSVSVTNGGGDTSAIDQGTWEMLGQTTGRVSLQGNITATTFVPTNTSEQTVPFIVVVNGPNDTPPGAVFGGGPFSGFEGRGFIGMAGGNKWPFPDDAPTYNISGSDVRARTLRLRPVDVTGKTNLQVTVAVAASFLDFENTDFLRILADLDGNGPGEPVELGVFSAPSSAVKYFADVKNGNANRLNLNFQDVTYRIPGPATQLALEFWASTTWWNEIVAFDNVRISSGTVVVEPFQLTAGRTGNNLELTWTGGNGPFVVQSKTNLSAATWTDVTTVNERRASIPMTGNAGFIRVQGK